MFWLIVSNLRTRSMRTALVAAAIGLSVSLVVAVTSGYASVESAAMVYLNRYLGGADAIISRPESTGNGPVPQRLIVDLARDPAVHRVTARLDMPSELLDKNGQLVSQTTFQIIGIERPADSRIDSLIVKEGKWFDSSTGNLAVVDQAAAAALKVGVGGEFFIPSAQGRLPLKVEGIIHKPDIIAAAIQTVYVPLRTLQRFMRLDGTHPQVSQIAIDFQSGASAADFAARWTPRLIEFSRTESDQAGHPLPPLKLTLVTRERSEVDLNFQSVRILSYLGGAISILAATFIIFSALSMGVSERQRTLAMLRAVGATRRQLAGLVIAEGLSMSVLGIAVGVPLGVGWTQFLGLAFPDFFTAGVTVSGSGIALAAAGSLAAALAASLLPAWSASRASPMEAMSPLAAPPSRGAPLGWAMLGLPLVALDPLIFFLPWEKLVAAVHPADADALTTLLRFYAHFALGVEGLFLGLFLLAPLLIWAMERGLAPLAGRLLRVPGHLLRQQLSQGLWRSAGAAAALMVGMAVLAAMTTQGTSMLDGWKLPDKFPDIFLFSFKFGGLGPAQWKQLGQVPGIRHFPDGKPELLPVAVTISGLGSNPLALMGAILAPNLNSTMFFGVPPAAAFQMIQLDFRDNQGRSVPPDEQAAYARRAERELEQGRHVIITEDYRRLHHVKYGDTISLYGNGKKYNYKVCGIVWSPGVDVIVAMFDLGRQLRERTHGMVFGSLADAQRDFGASNVNLFAANLDTGVEKATLLKRINRRLGQWDIKAGDVRQIKYAIDHGFRRLLLLLTAVAFGAMAVAAMGVTNTIIASIRSRRWQLGILRSIGLRRGELMRLVLGEACLLGLAGLALGLIGGTLLAMDARQLAADTLGYLPPLVIPWGYIGLGAAAVMAASILAALPCENAPRAGCKPPARQDNQASIKGSISQPRRSIHEIPNPAIGGVWIDCRSGRGGGRGQRLSLPAGSLHRRSSS
jgi:putative ABC transport system permease protein